LIPGAEKSGTTSLSYYLSAHPDIYIPDEKELHFFDDPQNYKKGEAWYSARFKTWNGESAVGECTPFYMYDPECVDRIKKAFPGIKLIFILRNPIDRAYSNYWHQVRGGKEFRSFEDALEMEKSRIAKTRYHDLTYSYLNKGFYAVQIERFLKHFSMDQILIVKFEDLKKEPQKVLNRIYGFLGIESYDNQMVLGVIKNKSVLPGSMAIQFAARKAFGKSRFFKAIAKFNLRIGKKNYPPMRASTRRYLAQCYQADISSLERISGVDLHSWKL
jgi:hypothetical protein